MKKIICFILLSILTLSTSFAKHTEKKNLGDEVMSSIDTVYHDAKAAVSTVYSDSKSILKDIYPDVKSAIVSISSAIGVAAEHVYTVLVKQYVVIGVKNLSMFVMFLVLCIIGLVCMSKLSKKYNVVNYKYAIPLVVLVVGIIGLCSVNYNDMFMGLINPEYGAINYIIETAKGLAK